MKLTPRRRSLRLAHYDYSNAGAYFVTVCTPGRAELFGEIVEGEMKLNDVGQVVEEEWLRTGDLRVGVELDAYVVMPNHFHGIVVILEGSPSNAPGRMQCAPTRSPTVGDIVRGFKAAVTRRVGRPVWQRNYYEHVVRDERDLERLRTYMEYNPGRWEEDDYHPGRVHAVSR